jgi:Ni,Fe-hydrogenase III small subunit
MGWYTSGWQIDLGLSRKRIACNNCDIEILDVTPKYDLKDSELNS